MLESLVSSHMSKILFLNSIDRENFGVEKSSQDKISMHFNFVNIQAYRIKLTQKFKYTENLAGVHVIQVDVDACYEW